MERRTRRMKSLLIRPAKLDSLTDPIIKKIKPNQVYNDYELPVQNKQFVSFSMSNTKRHIRNGSIESVNCSCECHKGEKEEKKRGSSKRKKRIQLLAPSPVKIPQKVESLRESESNSPVFPYKSYDGRLPFLNQSKNYSAKLNKIRNYFKY